MLQTRFAVAGGGASGTGERAGDQPPDHVRSKGGPPRGVEITSSSSVPGDPSPASLAADGAGDHAGDLVMSEAVEEAEPGRRRSDVGVADDGRRRGLPLDKYAEGDGRLWSTAWAAPMSCGDALCGRRVGLGSTSSSDESSRT